MLIETFDEAWALHNSESAHDRLKSARYFLRTPSVDHVKLLESWAATEKVGWVKRAIAIAIERSNNLVDDDPHIVATDPEQNFGHAYALALKDVAGWILHEMEPLIGLLEVKIKKEVPSYEESESRKHFENLQNYFGAISYLRTVSEIIKVESFDCQGLVAECLFEHEELGRSVVRSIGPSETVLVADRRLLKIALVNGLKNAEEASSIAKITRPVRQTFVNWGESEVEYWIAIVDDGVGLGRMEGRAIKIGESTKPGHFGIGLTIAQQAMQTLNGTLEIRSPNVTGAVFELRWLK